MYNKIADDVNNNLQEQISKFDNKANSLITIVGIIFALSLGIIETFNQFLNIELNKYMQMKLSFLIAFTVMYFICFIIELFFLLLVIYPRKKRSGHISINYYLDIANIKTEELRKTIMCNEKDIDSDIVQIKTNAIICREKHKYLVIAIWFLIPLFIFMFAMLLTVIIL